MMPMQVSVQANGTDAVQINNFYCSAGAPLDGPAEPRAAHAQDLEAALAKCESDLAQSETLRAESETALGQSVTALAQSETALAQSETARKDLAAALHKERSNMQALDAEFSASYEKYKDSLAQKTEEMQAFREEARKSLRELLDDMHHDKHLLSASGLCLNLENAYAEIRLSKILLNDSHAHNVELLRQLSQATEIERVRSEIVSFQHGGVRTCCAYKSGLSIFAIIVGLCIQLFLQARWHYR